MTTSDNRLNIQAAMRATFPEVEARIAPFYHMQEYHLGWRDQHLAPAESDPGKLIRPLLVLLACQAAGGDAQQALPLAAGIQLLHDFTLIHDDIEDDSATRRGRPTLWSLWGLAQGINAGDGMFVLAHLAIHRLHALGVPPERTLTVLRRFDETILRVCEGQFLDISFEGDLSITPEDYLTMIERKTSVLIAGACELGAIVAGASETTVNTLATFGLKVGLAFQIEDDILGIWGEPEVTGKPRAADLYRRKVSLPIVYALAHAAERETLAQIYRAGEPDAAAVQRCLAILDAVGARDYCAKVAQTHHSAAFAALAQLTPPAGTPAATAVQHLHALASSLIGRNT
ncbi:polyprenyl synthetase family protein [Candidatus Viridilinea mediisalina]|uniref:Polyprenyl synthetase n=1 Tax=Candidatus Viridilinea mediisalina TaxID=2024553 RepID=A0A2A6RJE9_9CHLR|nr:polyprenyl synthetase family protein [Candidatus Viridilinea mediisalina]PDW03015.1 polyprenyl synthetase [Candidatus Viridilinea mediisalina]